MLWLVLKSYEVIFKRFLVFSQSDEQGLAMVWNLKIVSPNKCTIIN